MFDFFGAILRGMRSLIVTVIAAGAGLYQAAPPSTEIFLAPFRLADGKVTLGPAVNISNSPGYDNQPSFTPDGRAVLFTSVRGDRKPDPANSAATGSDVYRYDIASRRLSQLTSTPESEYSPTVTPEGTHISVVRVEADGTQRLWRFAADGSGPELVLARVKPVGYHAWADADTLALFVLGTPSTLQIARVSTGKAEIVASDIGRSLSRIPGRGIAFVQRERQEGVTSLVVMQFETKTGQITPLVRLPSAVREADVAWTPDGTLLLAHDGKLHTWKAGAAELAVGADLAVLGLQNVSRVAVGPRGDMIALVGQL
jgi:hypothetical protein